VKDREELSKMINLSYLPFSFASSPYLVTYIQRIYNPLFIGIPRSTCRSDIFRLFGQYQTYIHYVFAIFLVMLLLLLILVVMLMEMIIS